VTWNRLVIAAIAVLGLVVVWDGVRGGGDGGEDAQPAGYRIDLSSAREGTWHTVSSIRNAFPGSRPPSLAISKVAVAGDGVVAVGVSHVPGDSPAVSAVELWDGEDVVTSFRVPAGSFARGFWFADDGRAIATIGVDGRGYLYDRHGRPMLGTAYFAYETG
jgi:hypothetical protein